MHAVPNRSAVAVENYVSETVFELQSNGNSVYRTEAGGGHFEYAKERLIKFRSWNLRRRSVFRVTIRVKTSRNYDGDQTFFWFFCSFNGT